MPTGGIQPFEFTAAILGPITEAVNSAMDVVVPIGIGIMGVFIGISVVKRVIFTFL